MFLDSPILIPPLGDCNPTPVQGDLIAAPPPLEGDFILSPALCDLCIPIVLWLDDDVDDASGELSPALPEMSEKKKRCVFDDN